MRIYHFMRYKWWFLGSLTAVTVFAIIAIFIVGLELGIDFRGGVRMEFALEQEASVDDVRSVVSEMGVEQPVVQSVGTPATGSAFMITAQEMGQDEIDRLKAELDARYGLDEEATGVEQVGASFGKETTNKAFIAVAVAVVAIIAYMSIRFEFKFAIPAIFALIHDVGLTLGIYAATHRLVTTATVAAILTILGYSVHDTIVIFDRMRENTLLMKKETYGDMVDLSIRQTVVRSINTTVCLVLPLLAILIFGGPTLKDFAMALTIGVVAGTYSSFFVAAPLVTIWKEREPRYRKRLAMAAAGGGAVVNVDPAEMRPQPSAAGTGPALARGARTTPSSQKKSKTGGKKPPAKSAKRSAR